MASSIDVTLQRRGPPRTAPPVCRVANRLAPSLNDALEIPLADVRTILDRNLMASILVTRVVSWTRTTGGR